MDLYGCVWFYIDLLWFVWSYIEFILCIYIKCQNKCVLNLCTLCIYINIYVFIYIYTYIYKYVYVYIYIYIFVCFTTCRAGRAHILCFPLACALKFVHLGGRKVKEVSHLRPSHVAKQAGRSKR
jgi:hypothetical protein